VHFLIILFNKDMCIPLKNRYLDTKFNYRRPASPRKIHIGLVCFPTEVRKNNHTQNSNHSLPKKKSNHRRMPELMCVKNTF